MLQYFTESPRVAKEAARQGNDLSYFVSLQQWRLIPYLAAAYALERFSKSLFGNFVEFSMRQMMRDHSDTQVHS